MIKSVSVVNYLGEILDLELTAPEKSGLYVQSITGISAEKASISTTDLASADGGVFNSARAEIRNIVITLGMYDQHLEHPDWSIEDARHLTYKFFPKKKPLTLTFVTDNREVYIDGYTESAETQIFSDKESVQISIICPDPNFYSIDDSETHMDSNVYKFEFPFENDTVGTQLTTIAGLPAEKVKILDTRPTFVGTVGYYYYVRKSDPQLFDEWIWLGSEWYRTVEDKRLYEPELIFTEINDTAIYSIDYQGEIEVGVVILIHFLDRVTNLTIYDNTMEGSIYIDTSVIERIIDSQIMLGDDLIINTKNGLKSATFVRNGHSYNILNAIVKTKPTWFILYKGENYFMFSAESGRDNVRITVTNQLAYEGV